MWKPAVDLNLYLQNLFTPFPLAWCDPWTLIFILPGYFFPSLCFPFSALHSGSPLFWLDPFRHATWALASISPDDDLNIDLLNCRCEGLGRGSLPVPQALPHSKHRCQGSRGGHQPPFIWSCGVYRTFEITSFSAYGRRQSRYCFLSIFTHHKHLKYPKEIQRLTETSMNTAQIWHIYMYFSLKE